MRDVATGNFSGRYRALVILISVFVFVIVSVLALNFYVSAQFERDALEINLAGRQRMLSQRTFKSLQDVQRAQRSGTDVTASFTEFENAFALFKRTLDAFDRGGVTNDANGHSVQLSAVGSGAPRDAVSEAQEVFLEYGSALQDLVDLDIQSLQQLADATRTAADVNDQLLSLMNDLTDALAAAGASSQQVNLAGRQRMLSQRIAKGLFELELAQARGQSIDSAVQELEQSRALFDSTLNAFASGGRAVDTRGNPIELPPVSAADARIALDQALPVWQDLESQISAITNGDQQAMVALSKAIAIGADTNQVLLRLMNDLTVALENAASRRSAVLRLIQVAGILLALGMFSYIVFGFVRQLRQSDVELDEARSETDRILETVKDGLFLMDGEYNIGGQHSASLPAIINEQEPAGKNFLRLLRKIVPEKTLETAEDYLGLLFGDRVNEDLVTDLNPLDEVEVYLEAGDGDYEVRHLEFGFRRARSGDDISHLLVQVDDISERVQLAKELKESQEKAQEQFDLMLKVLHVEPTLLNHFLNETEKGLRLINATLRVRTRGAQQNQEKIDKIYREIHSIKGDAAGLELNAFADKAHEFENMLEDLKGSSNLQGGDFLPLTIKLDEFMSQIDSLRQLILRLGDLQAAVQREELDRTSTKQIVHPVPIQSVTDLLGEKLNRFSKRLANDTGKQVQFSFTSEDQIPTEYESELNDIFTQLLRNSIVHGVESPHERVAVGKAEAGDVSVVIDRAQDRSLDLVFRDDGRGLSISRIRQAALEKGVISEEQAATLNKKQAIGLIFKPGFSTAKTDQHAGRGVGMDLIATRIRELSGQLSVRSIEGQFCEFRIRLPEPQNSQASQLGAA